MKKADAPQGVLIPMVGAAGAICRVVCDSNLPPDHPAQLDRRASALLETGLYAAGQQAIAASKSLSLPRSGFFTANSFALSVINPGDIAGLATENSRSAELGMALAWLTALCGKKGPVVAATGALDSVSSTDVLIQPVSHLKEKLRLLAEYFAKPTASQPPHYCLIPILDPDGQSTTAKYISEINNLSSLGVRVVAVSTLREACNLFNLTQLATTDTELQVRRAVKLIAALFVLVFVCVAWISRPLALSFGSAVSPSGQLFVTPSRALFDANGAIFLVPECKRAAYDYWHRYVAGERLAIKIGSVTDILPVYGVAVVVSKGHRARVMEIPQPRLDSPQGSSFTVDLLEPEQEYMLTIIARRLLPIDAKLLQEQINQLLENRVGTDRLSAVRVLSADVAHGKLEHFFHVVEKGDCI